MAESTFKAIPYEELPAIDKSIAEANAKSVGLPSGKAYIESRGGVNISGYYGDSYREGITLTDEEYAKAIRDAKESGATGGQIGTAVNTAIGIKAYNYYLSQGLTPTEAERQSGYTSTGAASTLSKETNNLSSGFTVSGYNPNAALYTASDGKKFTSSDAYVAYQSSLDKETAERKSAYDLLYQQFAKYGLQTLVTPLEGLIKEGVPASEFAIRLRETDAYQKRFVANKVRLNKGLSVLSEAEYIGLEDAYQGIMRQYGMPESYYARGEMGRQEGFEKFIGGDVSPAELETRISTAYNRVINSNPEVVQALKQFYPNITNGDILSYALDPEKALTDINKKVTAAEIGGAAIGAGLGIGLARAEELGAFGVSKAQAQQGYQTIADILPSATKLSSIYAKQGLGAYDQAVAEQEVFGISGAATAAQKRRKLTELETAQFSGQTGVGALARERAGQFQAC